MKNYLTRRNDNGLGFNFFDDAFEDFFKPIFYSSRAVESMRTDIKQTDKGYELSVDMPGFDKNEISLKLEKGYLTVSAQKTQKEEDKDSYVRRERQSLCSRSFYVGEGVQVEDVKAKYDNGILTINVPHEKDLTQSAKSISIE